MLSRHILKSRSILSLRPLRPPNPPPRPRPFTQNTALLLIAPHSPRPQLPYLAQPSFKPLAGPPGHLARLVSTESRAYIRELSFQSGKWIIIVFTFMFLGGVVVEGWNMEVDERRKPTPKEWSFGSRQLLRFARNEVCSVEEQRQPMVDWPKVGSHLKICLARLEDSGSKDGKDLVPVEAEGGGEILIPDVGKAGYDISSKSYEWRSGYFEVLLLAATAAEHLDNMVLDTRRKKVFPRETMLGPSNPDPRPTPVYMDSAPREEDCTKFFDPPETYYMKVLTTRGFTTTQRLEAVEGYANWLEFKNLSGAAEEMYRWGIDIATSALPDPNALNTVLDAGTNVLRAGAEREVTSNLLRATTNFATHHARTGDISSALPILLSVLRARRSAPISLSPPQPTQVNDTGPSTTDIGAALSMIKSLFSTPTYAPPLPSGDTPYTRSSSQPTCEEGELMLYIGEILFAASQGRESEGIGWTRQGVLVAEANLAALGDRRTTGAQGEEGEGRRCKECLLTGVRNWEVMLQKLTEQRASSSTREGGRDAGWFEWGGWFGSGGGEKGRTLEAVGAGVLEEELRQVGRLKERIVKEEIEVELEKGRPSSGLWVG